jgi:hypothetical protein
MPSKKQLKNIQKGVNLILPESFPNKIVRLRPNIELIRPEFFIVAEH